MQETKKVLVSGVYPETSTQPGNHRSHLATYAASMGCPDRTG